MFTDIDYRFFTVVRRERTRFYQQQMRRSRCSLLRLIAQMMLWPLRHAVWIPKTIYLLWLFKVQPREVQEKIISYLPAANGCLMVALDLYNTGRYVENIKRRGSPLLVAVQYRFGFIIVV